MAKTVPLTDTEVERLWRELLADMDDDVGEVWTLDLVAYPDDAPVPGTTRPLDPPPSLAVFQFEVDAVALVAGARVSRDGEVVCVLRSTVGLGRPVAVHPGDELTLTLHLRSGT